MARRNLGEEQPQDVQPNQGGELALGEQPNQGGELAQGEQTNQGGELALGEQVGQSDELATDANTHQNLDTETVETKKVRVLSNCAHGKANDVVALPVDEIKSAKEDGFVDDHPDAVAYAESLLNQQ